MKKIRNFFDRLVDKQVSPIGLAVFRIAYATVFFFEVLFIYQYKELFFDPIPFLEPAQLQFGLPLVLWLGVIICVLVGFQTRIATIVNYTFTMAFMSSITTFEYHMYYAFAGTNLLLIFMPINKYFSVDLMLNRTKRTLVSSIFYLLPVGIGVAFVYFDSIFFKFGSDIWTSGTGMWLPASLPQVSSLHSYALLDNKILMLSLGYFVFIFELVFLFFFWTRKMRIPLLIVGLGLHFGILFLFPIPLFAWGVIAVYLLMVPIKCWNYLFFDLLKLKKTTYVATQEFSKPKRKFFYVAMIIVVLLQLNITANFSLILAPITKKIYKKVGIYHPVSKVNKSLKMISTKFLGITPHGVFMDGHFKGYNHLIAVTFENDGETIWLPFITEEGGTGDYIKGANWVNWTFRVNAPKIKQKQLEEGLRDYIAFWAHKNEVSLEDASFQILVKKIDVPENFKWEEGFLKKQRAQPWQEAGTLQWIDNHAIISLPDIEHTF